MGETQVKGPVGSPGGSGPSPETPALVPGSPTQAAANTAAKAAELVAAGDAGAMALTATLPHAGLCPRPQALRHDEPVHVPLANQVISVGNRHVKDLIYCHVCVHSASTNMYRRLRFMPSCSAGAQSM